MCFSASSNSELILISVVSGIRAWIFDSHVKFL